MASVSPEWLERYWKRRHYLHDCIVQHCVSGTRPVLWSEAGRPETLSPRQRRIAAEAAAHGLVTGITVPVHGPGARFTLLSLGRYREGWPEQLPAEIAVFVVELLAHRFHAAVWRLADPTLSPTPAARTAALKPREMQCLTWAARGKSSAEIGKILGVSERTVYFHIGNAMQALGVTNRGQAIASAIALGLIAQ